MKKLIILIIAVFLILLVFSSYCLSQQSKIVINNERAGIMLLKGGYRAWWIRYSNGLKYPYRTFRDNLWCFPSFEHCDVRPLLNKIREDEINGMSPQTLPPPVHPDYDIVRFYAGALPVMYELMEAGILVPSDGNEDSIYLQASDNSIPKETIK